MLPTTLFFDLDGTLIINPFWKVVFPTISQAIAEASGKTTQQIIAEIVAEHDARVRTPLDDRPRTMDWDDIFQTVAARYEMELDISTESLVAAHAAPPYTAALDGAADILASLSQNPERRLVVASMGLAKYQIPVLKGLGLYDFFDDFLMPDTTGYLKTDRAFYGTYLEQPAQRIHIGDRYDHDCYFPKQFGGLSVMRLPLPEFTPYDPFERPQYLHEVCDQISGMIDGMPLLPEAVVIHLEELPAVIGRIEDQQ